MYRRNGGVGQAEVTNDEQQNVAKIKATGGVQMMIIPKENQDPPTKTDEEFQASAHRSNWTLLVKVIIETDR